MMIDRVECRRRGYLTERIFGEHCACPRCGLVALDAFRVAREMWRHVPIVIYGERDGKPLWYVDVREMERIPLEWECSKCGVRWYVNDSPNGFRIILLDLMEDADGNKN